MNKERIKQGESHKNILAQIILKKGEFLAQDTYSDAEWDILIHESHNEGVAPLVYQALFSMGNISLLPDKAQTFLRLAYASTQIQNQIIFKELEVLSRLFSQENIALVALKGIAFALSIYPDAGLRPMGDIDLLVPKEKMALAIELVQSLGYQVAKPEISLGLHDLLNHEVCLQKNAAHPLVVELHHSLVADKTYSYAVPVDWFWEQMELLHSPFSTVSFENLLKLKPEAQILYAAAHAILQHGEGSAPLRWFYDVDSLVRHYETSIDWKLLCSQVQTVEWGSALHRFLTRTIDYFDTPIPKRVMDTLANIPDQHLKLIIAKENNPRTRFDAEYQRLLSLNVLGRARLVFALLFPSPAYMRWRYGLTNPLKIPFFYFFRWGEIIKDVIRAGF